MGQFVSSISKTNIHPGQLSQRELLSSYLRNESPKTAFAFSTKSHKPIEGKQRETRPSILCVTQKRAFMPLYIVLGQHRACMPVYIGKSGHLAG